MIAVINTGRKGAFPTGTAVTAAAAAAITTALGEAYILIMDMTAMGELSENDLSSGKGKKIFADKFKENLKLKKE